MQVKYTEVKYSSNNYISMFRYILLYLFEKNVSNFRWRRITAGIAAILIVCEEIKISEQVQQVVSGLLLGYGVGDCIEEVHIMHKCNPCKAVPLKWHVWNF